jgi:ABC-type uncharacterized transport system permease subunit
MAHRAERPVIMRLLASSSRPYHPMGVNMTRTTLLAFLCGATLLAGCSVSKEGVSLSEYKFVDNNCTGNGFITNAAWCQDDFGPSMGPYTTE